LGEIRLTAGNSQLLALYDRREMLSQVFDDWSKQASQIERLWPSWMILQELLKLAGKAKAGEEVRSQAKAIEDQRLLLAEPDPVLPLAKLLEDALRQELAAYNQRYGTEMDSQNAQLEADSSWQKLSEGKRSEILQSCGITPAVSLTVGTRDDLIRALQTHPLKVWNDRIDALPERFACAREMASKELEPKSQTVNIPRRTLKSDEEIDAWVKEVTDQLKIALSKGPVVIR